ncbi:succinate dehydrogenase, cytochrome b556 subunit [bacterium]|nr:succinate dehydrogenase, cytochrome b556 subunit [bacterium]
MSQTGWTDTRPKSPHLQVWRWHVTMLGSILHRATGVGNYIGAMMIVGWLFAAASGSYAYRLFADLAGSLLGQLVLFGFTVSISYHLLNGVRHLALDLGTGFDPKTANATSVLTLLGGVAISVAIWVLAGLTPVFSGIAS